MKISELFEKDISRPINGVIKVSQDDDAVVRQEVEEYVITTELRKHFTSFFNFYGDAFDTPTDNIAVWISGFFGSGKSHFLKMLSYLLENRKIGSNSTVEYFREKFKDDPGTFMQIDKSTRHETETILFNIDIVAPSDKTNTVILRIFAKMFYNHLGYYGEDLRVARLEKFIAKRGKTEQFRTAFEEINGMPWTEMRESYAFLQDDIVTTLQRVLGMSRESADKWFEDDSEESLSIETLVREIRDYVLSKPKGFRLLFMIDEVGQYIGASTDLLLNLQSVVEEIGTQCAGRVWVVCTGQEAIDEIIKLRMDEFSRIQARFKTRLSLSSSSVDEVIRMRLLKKKQSVEPLLRRIYDSNDSALRNLFSFSDAAADIKGYSGPDSYIGNFPFVPYQFMLMQKAFAEIRKHGMAGSHLAGGERSMLSGFQESAMKIKNCDEYALVPFWYFYDTVSSFLSGEIRRAINRCELVASEHNGIEPYDVNILKLLFLIRHVSDDVKGNLENITILMADDIRADKITLKANVNASLERLYRQNYIGKKDEIYFFLSDEEQEIQRGIRSVTVDTAFITENIGKIVFTEIYSDKKFRYSDTDFPFESWIDGTKIGAANYDMKLRMMTLDADPKDTDELALLASSSDQVIVLLAENPYYEHIEQVQKIRKYVKLHNVNAMPPNARRIIQEQNEEAARLEKLAAEELRSAIADGQFYVSGQHMKFQAGDAVSKIKQAMEYLVKQVFSHMNDIDTHFSNDTEIQGVLDGNVIDLFGKKPNQQAEKEVAEYIGLLSMQHKPVSMAEIHTRYKCAPYGWREQDIAGVVATLFADQAITAKYAGKTVRADEKSLTEMLRKSSRTGQLVLTKHVSMSAQKLNSVKGILRDYFGVMNVPDHENQIVSFIIERFGAQKDEFAEIGSNYEYRPYPGQPAVLAAVGYCDAILASRHDNQALIDKVIELQDALSDSREDMAEVREFFANQKAMFDSALKLLKELKNDRYYFEKDAQAKNAIDQLKAITDVSGTRFNYGRIKDISALTGTIHALQSDMLDAKRKELLDLLNQCGNSVREAAAGCADATDIADAAKRAFERKAREIAEESSLSALDALSVQLTKIKDDAVSDINLRKKPAPAPNPAPAPKKRNIKTVSRQIAFNPCQLASEQDVDDYVAAVRAKLLAELKTCDAIDLK